MYKNNGRSNPIKQFLLFLWREFPFSKNARDLALFVINHKFIVGVLAIIADKRGLLLFHHTYIKDFPWGLPGGAAKDENLNTALMRELMEESNFQIDVQRLIGSVHTGGRQINFLFNCSLFNEKFKASEEVDKCEFFTLDNLPQIVPSHRIIIDALDINARKAGTWPLIDTDFQRCLDINKQHHN